MTTKTYAIFGAGAAGLYTAWRLLSGKSEPRSGPSKLLEEGDTLHLYDWGNYHFRHGDGGTRAPGARVCTWHYRNDPGNAYVELGGMRYSYWDRRQKDTTTVTQPGHRLVTTVVEQLGLDKYAVPFNESTNPLFYLRTKNMYLDGITSAQPAPYAVNKYGNASSPDNGFTVVENIAVTQTSGPVTRRQWDQFYQNGRITADMPSTSTFEKGDLLKNIGYWNLMYDQLGSEGFDYTADGNGYTSNVINWNAAVAVGANNEFAPGTPYKTLTTGYSGMFQALFDAIVKLAHEKGVHLDYVPNHRLHSILEVDGAIHYGIATREAPDKKNSSHVCAAAWLAMPRHALELVARATRYESTAGLDVLNDDKVQLYLESSILQPSYKIGMFFEREWWLDAGTPYAPQLAGYEVTPAVVEALRTAHFAPDYLDAIAASPVLDTAYASVAAFVGDVEQLLGERLTLKQQNELVAAAARQTIGPSVTDTPIRQVVYFGNNATNRDGKPVYGLLASYDDEAFTDFWSGLELNPNELRRVPTTRDTQPLTGPSPVPDRMMKMLLRQLAEVHFGPNADMTAVPMPLEARYIDWSLPPFNAGYHAWAAHYDIGDVQRKIRKPSQLIAGKDANLFIVGEAYSNDQAWVEGAYCTAESVLNDFFGAVPLIDNEHYPFICSARGEGA